MNKQLQTIFLLTDKPIISFNPKELKDHPLSIELFGDLSLDEYNSLKNDIKERGIQDALHIVKRNGDYIVISGHQRKKVAIEIGVKVPCIIRDDLKEEWQIEEQLIKDNLLRRHLTDPQKGDIGKHLEPIEEQRAKQRQLRKPKSVPLNLGEQKDKHKGERDTKIAEQLGVSRDQYRKIKMIRDKAPKEIKKEWQQGKITTHTAYQEVTKKGKGMSKHSRNTIFSNEHDNWATPPEIYKKLDDEFHFNFDPCPLNSTFNGLEKNWKKRNFVNPPYSDIDSFLEKGQKEINNGNAELNVYLIPARTDTRWFHKYVYPYILKQKHNPFEKELRFKKGRIKFVNGTRAKNSAPFPSMIIVFDRRKNEG